MQESTLVIDSRNRSGYPLSPSYKFALSISNITEGFEGKYITLTDFIGINYLPNVESEVEGKQNNTLQITLAGVEQPTITIPSGHYSLSTLAAAITALDASLTLTQSSLTGKLILTDSSASEIGFSDTARNNTILDLLGFTDRKRKGASGVITSDLPANLIKHDVIYIRCNQATGFYDALSNQRTNIIAQIPLGTDSAWGSIFRFSPTGDDWVHVRGIDPVLEIVDKWGFPVKNIGDYFLKFNVT